MPRAVTNRFHEHINNITWAYNFKCKVYIAPWQFFAYKSKIRTVANILIVDLETEFNT
jgi:hypothetical protein